MKKPIDILVDNQNYLTGVAIFVSLSAVSISIGEGEPKLIFGNYPLVMILLTVCSIGIVLIKIGIDNFRIQTLSKINTAIQKKGIDEFNTSLSELTTRQRGVYEKILSGKSNKEIMAELFIEQSTLKSHINQIYKKLNIKNRKELKSTKSH